MVAVNIQRKVPPAGEASKVLPPFLQKLKVIAETVPIDIADWSSDGQSYVVKDNERFEEVLKQHFKGSLQTFIRQLHFYGFRKLDSNTGWSFVHTKFLRDRPELVFEIRRKTRSDSTSSAVVSQVEVQQLRTQIASLQSDVDDLRAQLQTVLSAFNGCCIPRHDEKHKRLREERVFDVIPSDLNRASGIESRSKEAQPLEREDEPEVYTGKVNSKERDDVNDNSSFAVFDPLPADMEGVEDLLKASIPDERLLSCFSEELDIDNEEEFEFVATREAEKDSHMHSSRKLNSAVELVAEANELDPSTLCKVLELLKRTLKSEAQKTSKPQKGPTPGCTSTDSCTKIEKAILDGRPRTIPLRTQEVGAN